MHCALCPRSMSDDEDWNDSVTMVILPSGVSVVDVEIELVGTFTKDDVNNILVYMQDIPIPKSRYIGYRSDENKFRNAPVGLSVLKYHWSENDFPNFVFNGLNTLGLITNSTNPSRCLMFINVNLNILSHYNTLCDKHGDVRCNNGEREKCQYDPYRQVSIWKQDKCPDSYQCELVYNSQPRCTNCQLMDTRCKDNVFEVCEYNSKHRLITWEPYFNCTINNGICYNKKNHQDSGPVSGCYERTNISHCFIGEQKCVGNNALFCVSAKQHANDDLYGEWVINWSCREDHICNLERGFLGCDPPIHSSGYTFLQLGLILICWLLGHFFSRLFSYDIIDDIIGYIL